MNNNKPAPLPAIVRPVARLILRGRARTGRNGRRQFEAVEKWGGRLATRPLRTRLPNGCSVICDDLTDNIQRHIYFRGTYEPVEAFLFARLLKPGMTVIDAGANIGQYTMLAATAVGPSGAVHSFEPIPPNFARLQAHAEANGLKNVKLNRMSLWNQECKLTLRLPLAALAHSATGGWTIGEADTDRAVVEAEAIRLDTYAARCGLASVDVIKMDIEGAEPFALAGGRRLLESCRPTILMEVYRRALARLGSSPEMLWREFARLGYRAWRIGWSVETCGALANLDKVEFDNVLFHYRELPTAVTSGWHRRDPRRWACSGW